MSAVVFDDSELGKEYLCFMSEEAFSHGLTDENGAHTSVDVPPTNKCQLDLAEEGETTVKRQRVLSPTPAGDIGTLISATSQSCYDFSLSNLVLSRRFAYLAYIKSPHIVRLSIQTPT